ncbi:hypothetical protein BCR41DRAFT_392863 [Lobosporangium transversale]|uniref:Uncharacterized protein n=1 Tax=Lobosporangium transversale TaxID=64571 RepID=A0A1Y2GZ11_9FUNG|nr:hypothetical protein BCR41DRAFT_392863 [Lobosporangium transversale]ORZ27527.1 hypothetical protein BCR41DRAFT_392863 [Lobosporangium transversale]|eukprot:XP_021885254.1 hypothetical protein BCR41DRAFT_392863 [Lobosporangium transversale]
MLLCSDEDSRGTYSIVYEDDNLDDDEDGVDYESSVLDSDPQGLSDELESPPSSPTINDYQDINKEELQENFQRFMDAWGKIDDPLLLKRWVAAQRQLELFNEYRDMT